MHMYIYTICILYIYIYLYIYILYKHVISYIDLELNMKFLE